MWALFATVLFLPSPQHDLALTVQRHYDQVQDFEARFTQRYERRLLRRVIEETGTVFIKKPGRMRWEYETPEQKVFVSDGTRTYFYIPADNQVMVTNSPEDAAGDAGSTPLGLLSEANQILANFDVLASSSPPVLGGAMLRLKPKTPRPEYEEIELEVQLPEGTIRRLLLRDGQGNLTEFLFEEVRQNRGLPDSLFRFRIPPGTDVLMSSDTYPPRNPDEP